MNRSADVVVVAALLFGAVAPAGCGAPLRIGTDARVTCAGDDDCPHGSVCVEAAQLCASLDSPCVTESGDAVGDGTACGDGLRCVAGACGAPFCGDNLVDTGEECDDARDPLCRDDCTRARCGDGIVDVNEGCDDARADCVACSQLCPLDQADCNGDPSDGCECPAAHVGPADPAHLYLFETVTQGFLFATRNSTGADNSLDVVRVSLSTGAVDVIVPDALFGIFSADGDVAWGALALDGQPPITGPIVNGEVTDVLRVFGFGLAVSGDEVFVDHNRDGIYVHDAHTGETLSRINADICHTQCELTKCGDGVIAEDYAQEPKQFSLVERDGTVQPLFTADAVANFGCTPDGVPLWREGRQVVSEARDGTRRTIASLPPIDDTFFGGISAPILIVNGAPLYSLSLADVETTAFISPFGGIRSVGPGRVAGVHQGNLVLIDDLGGADVVGNTISLIPLEGL